MNCSKKVMYFRDIPVVPDRNRMLIRLGYRPNMTMLNDNYNQILTESIQRGLALCEPEGAVGRFSIINCDNHSVTLENGYTLQSASLAKLLKQSKEVLLMASTVGKTVVENIFSQIDEGNGEVGLIMDAAASQAADAVLDWIMSYMSTVLKREGKRLAKHRYSPGFGDLPLENQKILFDILDLKKLKLDITERYMLIPEKSVIAITGIEGM